MSDEEIRIAIAEACGFIPSQMTGVIMNGWRKDGRFYYSRELPDYLNDLNAIKHAVGLMCEKYGWLFQGAYTNALLLITQRRRLGCNEIQKYFWMAEADSRQRCEAFMDALAILNLSTDSPNVETKEQG